MQAFLRDRFEVIRTLGRTKRTLSFLGRDRWFRNREVFVKCIAAGTYQCLPGFEDQSAWWHGIRHASVSSVDRVGLTPRKDLFAVRHYYRSGVVLPPLVRSGKEKLVASLVAGFDLFHSEGLVHGRIKPSNLLLTGDTLTFLDGGLPPVVEAHLGVAEFCFTAPEVLRGAVPTGESDLYSLGSLLYRIYSGLDLFDDANPKLLRHKCLHATPVPLDAGLEAPRQVSEAVMGLLDQDSTKRLEGFRCLKGLFPSQTPATRAPLVGRQVELAQTRRVLETPGPGLRILAVRGEMGAGKTRFLEEVAFRSELNSRRFLLGRSFQGGNRRFGPILQLIEARFQCPDRALDLWMETGAPSFAHSLSLLFPETPTPQEPERAHDLPLSMEKLVADLAGILISFTKTDPSLTIAIEDVHWADEATFQVLEQFCLRAGEIDLTLVLTARTSQLRGTARRFLNQPQHPDTQLAQVVLHPLRSAAALRIAQSLAGTLESAIWAVENAGGNPFFIEECVRYVNDRGTQRPPRVEDVLLDQVNLLDPESKSIAETLSLLARPLPIDAARKALCGLCKRAPVHIDSMIGTGILVDSAGTLTFRHDAIREVLSRHLSPARRRRLHRDIHTILLKQQLNTDSVAYHAAQAGLTGEALAGYEKAAMECLDQQDHRTAIELFSAAKKLLARTGGEFPVELHLAYAECLVYTGSAREAREILEQILAHSDSDSEVRAFAYRILGACSREIPDDYIRCQQLAIEQLPKTSTELPKYLLNLAQAYANAGKLSEARRTLRDAEQRCGKSAASALEWLALKGLVLLLLCDHKGAQNNLLHPTCEQSPSLPLMNNRAVCIEHLGSLVDACSQQARVLEQSHNRGMRFGALHSLANLGAFETKRGRFAEAGSFFGEAERFCRTMRIYRDGDRTNLPLLAADQATLQMEMGNYAASRKLMASATRQLKRDHSSQRAIWVALKSSELYARTRETQKMRNAFKRVEGSELLATDFFKVERAIISGRVDDLRADERSRLLEEGLRLVGSLGTLYQRCRILIELATLLVETDQDARARRHLIEAQKLASRHHYGLLQGRIRFLRGLTAQHTVSRVRFLEQAYRLASELPLPELAAESAFRLGKHHLDLTNLPIAREYLSKSVEVTASLAEQIPVRARDRYLKTAWRKEARNMLDDLEKQTGGVHKNQRRSKLTDRRPPLFKALYETTMSLGEAGNIDEFVEVVTETLTRTFRRGIVVFLTVRRTVELHERKLNLNETLSKRIARLYKTVKEGPAFESGYPQSDAAGAEDSTVAWIPLGSRGNQFGGIYVDVGPKGLTESEMEFLTALGIISSNTLATILWSEGKPELSAKPRYKGIVGTSREIERVCAQIGAAAGSPATVLIEGESGTGKELVARAIHDNSPRSNRPLITVDCGAIPDTLIESELFGSRRGSFTGATMDRTGLIEAADKGTLFLDEIANTSLALQARLLRVLQEKEVRRLGDTKSRRVDVRLIAATNSDLESLVRRGLFRQDLLFRLNVLHIQIPPLRDRREDILLIARTFLGELNKTNGTKKRFHNRALETLVAGSYAGNVRELQNLVERAYFTSLDGNLIKDVNINTSNARVQSSDEIQSWFKDLTEGEQDFWTVVHSRYKSRDISREKVVALMDLGLRATRGSYKGVASLFHVKEAEYRRFMDFLRRNDCQPDFRPYRKLPGP